MCFNQRLMKNRARRRRPLKVCLNGPREKMEKHELQDEKKPERRRRKNDSRQQESYLRLDKSVQINRYGCERGDFKYGPQVSFRKEM